jgi:hypothetical protein
LIAAFQALTPLLLKLPQGQPIMGRGELGTDPFGRVSNAFLILHQDRQRSADNHA